MSAVLFNHYKADAECMLHSAWQEGNKDNESEKERFISHGETPHEQKPRLLLSWRMIVRMGTSLLQSQGSSDKE